MRLSVALVSLQIFAAATGSTCDVYQPRRCPSRFGERGAAMRLAMDVDTPHLRRWDGSALTEPARNSTTAPKQRRSRSHLETNAYRVPVSSIKAAVGHMLGASGAVRPWLR